MVRILWRSDFSSHNYPHFRQHIHTSDTGIEPDNPWYMTLLMAYLPWRGIYGKHSLDILFFWRQSSISAVFVFVMATPRHPYSVLLWLSADGDADDQKRGEAWWHRKGGDYESPIRVYQKFLDHREDFIRIQEAGSLWDLVWKLGLFFDGHTAQPRSAMLWSVWEDGDGTDLTQRAAGFLWSAFFTFPHFSLHILGCNILQQKNHTRSIPRYCYRLYQSPQKRLCQMPTGEAQW